MKIELVEPEKAWQGVASGKVLLVCAYPDENRCKGMMLRGAISYQEFKSRLPSLSKDQEIVFYCA
jgi:hypothetical protein